MGKHFLMLWLYINFDTQCTNSVYLVGLLFRAGNIPCCMCRYWSSHLDCGTIVCTLSSTNNGLSGPAYLRHICMHILSHRNSLGVIVDHNPLCSSLCILRHGVMPRHTSLSYSESMVKPQPLSGLPDRSQFFQSLHFISGPLTPQERGSSSNCPVTCFMSSLELSLEAWDWKTLSVVEEGTEIQILL